MKRSKHLALAVGFVLTFGATIPLALSAEPSLEQQAVERAQIENMIAAATRAYDMHDAEAYRSYFTKEAQARIPPGFLQGDDVPWHQHIVVNSYIEFTDATHAKHSGYWITFPAEGERNVPIVINGAYDDKLVKVDGKWLYAEKGVRFFRSGGGGIASTPPASPASK